MFRLKMGRRYLIIVCIAVLFTGSLFVGLYTTTDENGHRIKGYANQADDNFFHEDNKELDSILDFDLLADMGHVGIDSHIEPVENMMFEPKRPPLRGVLQTNVERSRTHKPLDEIQLIENGIISDDLRQNDVIEQSRGENKLRSLDQYAKSPDQYAKSPDQYVKSRDQYAKSRDQYAKPRDQYAKPRDVNNVYMNAAWANGPEQKHFSFVSNTNDHPVSYNKHPQRLPSDQKVANSQRRPYIPDTHNKQFIPESNPDFAQPQPYLHLNPANSQNQQQRPYLNQNEQQLHLAPNSKQANAAAAPQARVGYTRDTQRTLFEEARISNRVFYNRVPKCGSEGVVGMFRVAAKRNNFNVVRSHVFQDRFLNASQQMQMINEFQQLEQPVVFDRHVYFTNFKSFKRQMPVYINVVRDPVERFISAYYFNKKNCYNDKCKNETLEQCLLADTFRCNMAKTTPSKNRMWITIPFFCGHHEICNIPGRIALDMAKRNAEKYYLVVGVLEELDRFYYVLETAMPHLFGGTHQHYLKNLDRDKHIKHGTKGKPVTSQWARDTLKQQLHLEYELYEFLRQLVVQRQNYIKKHIHKLYNERSLGDI